MQRGRSAFGFDNMIHAIGGDADGIVLTLTPEQVTREDGVIMTSVYSAMKVDSGPGPVVLVDPKGALLNGQPKWELRRQYEWAILVWDGVAGAWDVLADRASRLSNSRVASSAEPSPQPSTR
jgi:hypothetical protein